MKRPTASCLRCAVVACCTSFVASVAAEPEEGRWLQLGRDHKAESCLSESDLAERIERQLGRSPAAAAREARVVLIATIQAYDVPSPRWQASMKLVNDQGEVLAERSLRRDEPSCTATGDALAVIGSLLLDREAPAVEADNQDGQRNSWQVTVAAAAVAERGLLPLDRIGGSLSIWGRLGSGPVGYVRVEMWPDQWNEVAAGRAVKTGLIQFGLGACLATTPSREFPVVGICLGLACGALWAQGMGFAKALPTTLGVGSLTGTLWLQQPLPLGFVFLASARADLALARDHLSYESKEGAQFEFFRMSAVSAVGELGLGYRLR